MNENCKLISNTLSLRKPQRDSLEILSQIIGNIELSKTPDLPAVLQEIKNIATQNDDMLDIKEFERDFPSICFSLATGVGKTRLMGAFISYLYFEKGVKNFFVLAPNLTIYNKLKGDFRLGNPKYVFKGIQEFLMDPPEIITGNDYFTMGGLDLQYNKDKVKIN